MPEGDAAFLCQRETLRSCARERAVFLSQRQTAVLLSQRQRAALLSHRQRAVFLPQRYRLFSYTFLPSPSRERAARSAG